MGNHFHLINNPKESRAEKWKSKLNIKSLSSSSSSLPFRTQKVNPLLCAPLVHILWILSTTMCHDLNESGYAAPTFWLLFRFRIWKKREGDDDDRRRRGKEKSRAIAVVHSLRDSKETPYTLHTQSFPFIKFTLRKNIWICASFLVVVSFVYFAFRSGIVHNKNRGRHFTRPSLSLSRSFTCSHFYLSGRATEFFHIFLFRTYLLCY